MIEGSHVFCFLTVVPVRSSPKDQAEIVTQMIFGEVATVLKKKEQWIKLLIAHDGYEGWVDFKQLIPIKKQTFSLLSSNQKRQVELLNLIHSPWGKIHTLKGSLIPSFENNFKIENQPFEWEALPTTNSTKSIIEVALDYMNAPYLWGGRTLFGIDCSGFTQLVFSFFGVNLPRDASDQVNSGREINYDATKCGDCVFFSNEKGKVIHVGIILEANKIIHASGKVRIDVLTNDGIFNNEINEQTHKLHSVKRFLR